MKLTNPMKLTNRTLRPVRPRPWKRHLVRPLPREVMVLDRLPEAQICIYSDCVIVTRRTPTGAWRSYPVSPEALAQAIGKLPVTAGLLPEGTIGTGLRDGDPFYVQYIQPRAARLQVDEGGRAALYHLQLPPLIWAGWRTQYRIFALSSTKPVTDNTPLYCAPLPNTYSSGGICWGSVRLVRATPTALPQMLKVFLEESLFNAHVDNGKSRSEPGSVLRLLRRLALRGPDHPYPLDDLVRANVTLNSALNGAIWSTP